MEGEAQCTGTSSVLKSGLVRSGPVFYPNFEATGPQPVF